MVTGSEKLLWPSHIKSCMGFPLACIHLTLTHLKEKVMHISTANILAMVTDMKVLLLSYSRYRWPIIKVIVTVMHISTAYIGNG